MKWLDKLLGCDPETEVLRQWMKGYVDDRKRAAYKRGADGVPRSFWGGEDDEDMEEEDEDMDWKKDIDEYASSWGEGYD
jgi:hypothetical protein